MHIYFPLIMQRTLSEKTDPPEHISPIMNSNLQKVVCSVKHTVQYVK